MSWLFTVYKEIINERQNEYRVMAQIAPLARTPMDKKSGQGMRDYFKDVMQMIDRMSPWSNKERYERKKRYMKSIGVKPGQIVVVLNGKEASSGSALFADAKVINGN